MSQLPVPFRLSDYAYDLPMEKIAQTPCKDRSEARLLHLNRKKSAAISHYQFKDITALLREDDLLVINNTRVVPARLLGTKETGGKVEVLIIDYASFVSILQENGNLAMGMIRRMSKDGIYLINRMMSLSHKQLPGRIAEVILYFSEEIYKNIEFEGVDQLLNLQKGKILKQHWNTQLINQFPTNKLPDYELVISELMRFLTILFEN